MWRGRHRCAHTDVRVAHRGVVGQPRPCDLAGSTPSVHLLQGRRASVNSLSEVRKALNGGRRMCRQLEEHAGATRGQTSESRCVAAVQGAGRPPLCAGNVDVGSLQRTGRREIALSVKAF